MNEHEARDAREALVTELQQFAEAAKRDGLMLTAGLMSRAAVALESVSRKHPEPEWEYALRGDGDTEPYSDVSEDLDWLLDGTVFEGTHTVRRTKAGPWEPIA